MAIVQMSCCSTVT